MKRPTVRELLSRIEELEAEVERLKAAKPMTAEDWIRVLRETQTPAVPSIPQIFPSPYVPQPIDPLWPNYRLTPGAGDPSFGYPQIICGSPATHFH